MKFSLVDIKVIFEFLVLKLTFFPKRAQDHRRLRFLGKFVAIPILPIVGVGIKTPENLVLT